jgi:hypothetical protein
MIFRQSMTPVSAGAVAGPSVAANAIAAATACAIWTATSRIVRTDPTAALRVE